MLFENPYNELLEAVGSDLEAIQAHYELHRNSRNALQRSHLLSESFTGWSIDPVLVRLIREPGLAHEIDQRHCLVFWARPPAHICDIVQTIQQRLENMTSSLWLMPLTRLHMNTFEITHSRTTSEITELVKLLEPTAAAIVDYTYNHRARLVKPLLGYDASGVALTFIPAAGEPRKLTEPGNHNDDYTYHHLRRDLYSLCTETGLVVSQRYTVPSAHMTIARFVEQEDFVQSSGMLDRNKIENWIGGVESINEWLIETYWPSESQTGASGEGEWTVGHGSGLDHRRGTLWYGGGESVRVGKGF